MQHNWSNQIIAVYLIGQFKPWIWYHFTAVKLQVSFLVMALSHWYPHIICNKTIFDYYNNGDDFCMGSTFVMHRQSMHYWYSYTDVLWSNEWYGVLLNVIHWFHSWSKGVHVKRIRYSCGEMLPHNDDEESDNANWLMKINSIITFSEWRLKLNNIDTWLAKR